MLRRLPLVLFVLASVGGAIAADVPFDPPRTLPGDGAWSRAVLADLEGDGDLDVVAIDTAGDRLVLFESVAPGLYGAGRSLTANPALIAPSDVGAADLDRDGDLDLVVTARDGDVTLWLEQVAPLDFGDPATNGRVIDTDDASGPTALALVDLDRDGDLDVAVATGPPSSVVVWFENDGRPALTTGEWDATAIWAGSAASFTDLVAGDLDGDGDDDLVAASLAESSVAWFENLGDGDFGTPATSRQAIATGPSGARGVALADLDRDGDLDVAAASTDADHVRWFRNDGPTISGFGPTTGPTSAGGGGRDPIDLAPAGGASSGAEVPAGLDWSAFVVDAVPAAAVVAVDLDVDGDDDLLVARPGGAPAWYENDGGGPLAPATALPSSTASSSDVRVADVDGDGDPDVLAAATGPGSLELFEHRAIHRNATFDWRTFIALDPPDALAAGRLDDDGLPDLFVADAGGGAIEQIDGEPSGSRFAATPSFVATAFDVTRLAACDVDRDGDTDAVAANADGLVSWFDNAFGDGPSAELEISGAPGSFFTALATADLDRDGDQDVLTGRAYESPNLQWWENDGTPGAFDDWARTDVGTRLDRITAIATGDVDRDGDLDVIVGAAEFDCGSSGEIVPFTNDGDGGLAVGPTIDDDAADRVHDVRLADLDGDGRLDVLAAWDSAAGWYAGDGSGAFGAFAAIDSGRGFEELRAVDLDLDGDADVLARDEDGRTLEWFENLGGGSFVHAATLWAGGTTFGSAPVRAVEPLDVDRDAMPDVVFSANRLY